MTSTAISSAPLRIVFTSGTEAPVRHLTGTLLCGEIRDGARLIISPDNQPVVASKVVVDGDRVTLTLEEDVNISGPAIASLDDDMPVQTDVFLLALDPPLSCQQLSGQDLSVDLVTGITPVTVQLPDDTGEVLSEIVVRCDQVVALDEYSHQPLTGACDLRAGDKVMAHCRINMKGYTDQRLLRTVRATNITRVHHRVTAEDRTRRFGHTGGVLWITGLSGSGKSTLAVELETELFNRGFQVYVLDGDNIRHGLNANLGFSPEDRSENIRRVGEVAALFARAGFIAISAFISPYQSDRERARAAAENFHEIYLSAGLDVCEQRDPKGLYVKARKGEIADFTGISAPYEQPDSPALTVDTGRLTIEESVRQMLDYIEDNFSITPGDAV
jgi:bifunctional enzyme CysN/CysC